MRWTACVMVWLSIIGHLALMAYGIVYSVQQYIYCLNNPAIPSFSLNVQAKVQSLFEEKEEMFNCLNNTSHSFCNRYSSYTLPEEDNCFSNRFDKGSKAVSTIISTMFFPIIPWILQISTIGFAIITGLYLASVGSRSYVVIGNMTSDKCIYSEQASSYVIGSYCDPKTFNDNCNVPRSSSLLNLLKTDSARCVEAGCYFEKINSPIVVGYFS